MKYQIREMLEADWPEVSKIYREGLATNLATFQTECPDWETWNASHLKVCRFVAAIEGKVAGWVALTAVSSRCVYAGVAEVSVYIGESYRGTGAGKALLTEMIRRSEESGFWTLQSGIMQENVASVRLHESCGFRMVGYREKIAQDRFGRWRNTVLMERRSESDRFGCGSKCACGGKETSAAQ